MDAGLNGHDKGAAPAELNGYLDKVTERTHAEPATPVAPLAPVVREETANIALRTRRYVFNMTSDGDKGTGQTCSRKVGNALGLALCSDAEKKQVYDAVSAELGHLFKAGLMSRERRSGKRPGERATFWFNYTRLAVEFDPEKGLGELITKRKAATDAVRREEIRAAKPPADIASEGPAPAEPIASKIEPSLMDRIEGFLKLTKVLETFGPSLVKIGEQILAEVEVENRKPNLALATDDELLAEVNARLQRRSRATH